MKIVRTIVWILILFVLLIFSIFNWDPVEVTLWENMVLETKVPALVIIAFLLGLFPMWLYHRTVKWNLNRRISSLENAARSNALARHEPSAAPKATPAPEPAATAASPAPLPEPDASAPKDDSLTPDRDENT